MNILLFAVMTDYFSHQHFIEKGQHDVPQWKSSCSKISQYENYLVNKHCQWVGRPSGCASNPITLKWNIA